MRGKSSIKPQPFSDRRFLLKWHSSTAPGIEGKSDRKPQHLARRTKVCRKERQALTTGNDIMEGLRGDCRRFQSSLQGLRQKGELHHVSKAFNRPDPVSVHVLFRTSLWRLGMFRQDQRIRVDHPLSRLSTDWNVWWSWVSEVGGSERIRTLMWCCAHVQPRQTGCRSGGREKDSRTLTRPAEKSPKNS